MKYKAISRLFHMFLCLCIMVTVSLSGAINANASPTPALAKDIKGNQVESQISYLLKKGILTTYSDKTFRPNQNVKRIEFITAVNKLFGFVQTSNISYKDVPAGSVYYKEVSKAISAGYIVGYSDMTFKPNNPISRQEAAEMICKLLNSSAVKNTVVLSKVKDLKGIPDKYLAYISTVLQNGYLGLYTGNLYKPAKAITRADMAYFLCKAVKTVFNKSGTYQDADGLKSVSGNVVVSVPDVNLQNIVINGNLYLSQGIGEGNISLLNVTVKGKTFISGGGMNSVLVMDSTLGDTIINKRIGAVRIAASGRTVIGNLTVNSLCRLEENSLSGNGFGNITVSLSSPVIQPVQLIGNFDNVTLNSRMTEVDLSNGSITNFSSGQGATGTTLKIDSTASIKNLVLNSSASVQGKGTIRTVDIRSAGVTMEQTPTYGNIKNGITAIIGGSSTSGTITSLPTLTGAVIDLSTGKLTLTGKNLVSLSGANNDITASKLTISSGIFGKSKTLTASSNADILNSTSAVLTLTDADMTAVKSMLAGTSKSYKISAAMGWNGATSPPDYDSNVLTITGNLQPVLNSATLNLSSGVLTLSGSYLTSVSGSSNDITASKLTISDSNGGHSRTLSYTSNSEINNSSSATFTLSSTDLTAIKAWALQNGVSINGYSYNIAAAAGWNGTNSQADLINNPVTISGNPLPTITSATLNTSNGQLVITGTNLISLSGSANDITASKLTLSDGSGGHSRTLSTTSNVDITNNSTATLTVSGSDLTAIASWAVQNGTSLNGFAYNLSAAAGWNGSDSLADLTGNPVTVSGGTSPTISSATLNLTNGYLVIYGSNLASITGTNNDILSPYLIITDGSGGHSRTLSYTPNFDTYSTTTVTIILASSDLSSIAAWATQNGTSVNGYPYYLNASAGWNGPYSGQDTSNPLTISGNTAPSISSATLNVSTGQLVLTGTNFNSIYGYDITASCFTIYSSSNAYSRQLQTTSNVEITSSTSATLTVTGGDLTSIASWAKQDGTTINGYYYYLTAAVGWNGPNSITDSANQITVSGNQLPSISNATLDVSNGSLAIQGTNFLSIVGANNDIIPNKFTITDGAGGHTYTLTTPAGIDLSGSSTLVSFTLSSSDLTAIKLWATQNGTNLNGNNYRLIANAGWNGSTSLADSGKQLTISGNALPTITSAILDINTGRLDITGTNFIAISGGNNDINLANLSLSDGIPAHSIVLTSATTSGFVEISGSTSITVTLPASLVNSIKTWATQNGTSNGVNSYNLAASAGWNGVDSGADLTGNALTISGYSAPTLTSATLSIGATSAVLTLTGSNFIYIAGSTDINAQKFTLSDGAGGHMTPLSAVTANVDITSTTSATLTIVGTDLDALKTWVTQNGTTVNSRSYLITATAGWNGPTSLLMSNISPVTVSGVSGLSITAVTRNSCTQVTVTLNKLANSSTISKANDGGFIVCDSANQATTYNVSNIAPGPSNDKVILTTAYTGTSSNIIVKYNASGNGTVSDESGNPLATNNTGMTATNVSVPAIAGGLSFADAPGSANDGNTIINFSSSGGSNTYKYKVNPNAITTVGYQVDGSWTDVVPGALIVAPDGTPVGLAEVNGSSVVSYSTANAYTKNALPAVKTASGTMSNTIDLQTMITTNGAIIMINTKALNLSDIAVLGDGYDTTQSTKLTNLIGLLNAAASTAGSGCTFTLDGSNHLVVTSTDKGSTAVVNFTGSTSGPNNNLLQALGLGDITTVYGSL